MNVFTGCVSALFAIIGILVCVAFIVWVINL